MWGIPYFKLSLSPWNGNNVIRIFKYKDNAVLLLSVIRIPFLIINDFIILRVHD